MIAIFIRICKIIVSEIAKDGEFLLRFPLTLKDGDPGIFTDSWDYIYKYIYT